MGRQSKVADSKREAILRAARSLFLEHGFASTSVDAVTAAAGVSKPTVYNHFPTKEALLEGVVQRESAHASPPMALPITGDIRQDIEAVARLLMTLALSPDSLAWDRMMAGEARRMPELGRLFFDHGPRRIIDLLTGFFRVLGESGRLHITDPESVAELFFGMVVGLPLLRAQLTGEVTSQEAMLARCREIADRFVRAYSPLESKKS